MRIIRKDAWPSAHAMVGQTQPCRYISKYVTILFMSS